MSCDFSVEELESFNYEVSCCGRQGKLYELPMQNPSLRHLLEKVGANPGSLLHDKDFLKKTDGGKVHKLHELIQDLRNVFTG